MASVVSFVPGSSPCDGACSLDWAAQEFDVPVGDPVAMTLPQGSFLSTMSYAHDGVPGTSQGSYVTVSDHHGMGYELADGAVMFQFSECGNWSVAHPSQAMLAPGQQIVNAGRTGDGWTSAGLPIGLWSGGSGSQASILPNQVAVLAQDVTPVNWVPTPGAPTTQGGPPISGPPNLFPEFEDETPGELIPIPPPFSEAPPLPTPVPGAALLLGTALVALLLWSRRAQATGV